MVSLHGHDMESTSGRHRHASATGDPQGKNKGEVTVAGKLRLTRRRWQEGDGRQGSKDPGRLVNTCL